MTDNFKKITQEQSVAIGQNKAVNILKAINKEKKRRKHLRISKILFFSFIRTHSSSITANVNKLRFTLCHIGRKGIITDTEV